MTDARKHPSAAFWLTVALVAVLVGYPLSFGPACWLVTNDYAREEVLRAVYWPLVRGSGLYPGPVQSAARRYVDRWLPPFWEFTAETDTDLFWFFFDERAEAGDYRLIPMASYSNETSTGT